VLHPQFEGLLFGFGESASCAQNKNQQGDPTILRTMMEPDSAGFVRIKARTKREKYNGLFKGFRKKKKCLKT
jgi:hypothetical protein